MSMTYRVLVTGVAIAMVSSPSLAALAGSAERVAQRSAVYWAEPGLDHGLEDPVRRASATLVRVFSSKGASAAMHLNTRGLHAGHAYTVWWNVLNRPESCTGIAKIPGGTRCGQLDWTNPMVEASDFFAAGAVAGDDGTASFKGRLKEGEDRVAFEMERGRAFTNPRGADIVLWVRDHGPYDPARYGDEQLTTFNGGCANYLPGGSGDSPGDYPCSNQQVASFAGLS